MTNRRLGYRHLVKRARWLSIRWGVVAGGLYACFLYIYPFHLVNASPDILPLLAAYPTAWRLYHRLLAWLPENTVLPLLYGIRARLIDPDVEYAWLLFLSACMAAAVACSFLLTGLWRFLSGLGVRAARRARRAFWLFWGVFLLVVSLNAGLCALVLHASGRQLATFTAWEWLMDLGIFVAVPAVTLLSAWRAAPMRISGKRSFFR